MSYASFLAIVPIAIAISRLGGLGEISAGTMRFAAVVLTSQSLLLAASGAIDTALGRPKLITEDMRADADACSKRDAIRDLADLPPGLIAAHIDIGAYIAALTHHRALSAPYHRIANAIIANYQIFAAHDPAAAAAILKRENVDYVVICRGLDAPSASTAVWKDTLRANLDERRCTEIPDACAAPQLPNSHLPRLARRPSSAQSSAFNGRCISAVIASSTTSRPSMMPCTASAIGISTPFSRASLTSAADV